MTGRGFLVWNFDLSGMLLRHGGVVIIVFQPASPQLTHLFHSRSVHGGVSVSAGSVSSFECDVKFSILVLGFTAAHGYNCKENPHQLYAKLDQCKWHLSKFWHWISDKSLSSKCTNDEDKGCMFVLMACCCVIASLGCRSCGCMRFWVLMCQFFDVEKTSSECDCIVSVEIKKKKSFTHSDKIADFNLSS